MLHNNGAKVVVFHETTKSLHHFFMEDCLLDVIRFRLAHHPYDT